MVKIKITTDKKVWVNGRPQTKGSTAEVDPALADLLIDRGFAEKVRGAPRKKGSDDVDL